MSKDPTRPAPPWRGVGSVRADAVLRLRTRRGYDQDGDRWEARYDVYENGEWTPIDGSLGVGPTEGAACRDAQDSLKFCLAPVFEEWREVRDISGTLKKR